MHSELLLEFSSGWACDNGMMAMSIRAGEPVDPAEFIELCSGARTLFGLATLVCRGIDRVLDCRRVWTDTLETFQQAQDVWTDVQAGQDPLLRFYLLQLERLNELAAARVDLYMVSQSERLEHASRRADTSELSSGTRGGPKEEAQGWTDTRPAHVYSMGRI